MNREDLLELSNSKSALDSQSTALFSATKIGSVDKLLEDQDSMTFSDILRGDLFKTPQKSSYQLFPLPKQSPPTKSAFKESLDDQLGKRSDLEKRMLDSHLDQYMSRLACKITKRTQAEHSQDQSIQYEMNQRKLESQEVKENSPSDSLHSLSFLHSTKFDVSREKLAKDIDTSSFVDHKGLFERLGNNIKTSRGEEFQESPISRPNSTRIVENIMGNLAPLDRPFRISQIINLCKNISSEALSLIPSIREVKNRQLNQQDSTEVDHDPCLNNDSSSSDDLAATSETLSLKNFPSNTRKSSETMQSPENLPEPLFILFTKFSKLDFSVQESSTFDKVSLWRSHVSSLQKTADM